MADFPYQIVGFDLDGTLLDTTGDLAAALNAALAADGRAPLTVDQVRPMIGGGALMMLKRALNATPGTSPALPDRLFPIMLSHYEAHIDAHTRPYPGAVAAVDALRALGVRTAIVTNKAEHLAVKLIEDLRLSTRFDTIIGGDTMGPGNAKPSAAPIREMIGRLGGGRAAFVGDTAFDTLAAKNAGIQSVAVSFGFLTHPASDLGADAVIDDFSDLVQTLIQIGA